MNAINRRRIAAFETPGFKFDVSAWNAPAAAEAGNASWMADQLKPHQVLAQEAASQALLRTYAPSKTSRLVSYFMMLAIVLLGAFHAPLYLLLLGAAALSAIAVRNQRHYQGHCAASGTTGVAQITARASAAHALLASFAAYAIGAAAALIVP